MKQILPRIKQLLKKYPYFLEKHNSNLYKHVKGINNQFLDLYVAIKILGLAKNLEKSIRIHKIQNIEHYYTINVDIFLDNIKKFSFYKDIGNRSELLFEKEFELGINEYLYSFDDKSKNLIPEDKFFVIVETYDEYLFVKGFPENDDELGDIYDHDNSLDVLGGNLNVPRKKYVPVSDNQLYRTEPPFNNKLTEDDYHYQNRIIKYVNEFEKSFLPILDIWKFYSLNTVAQNRHHLLSKQNISFMRDDEDENNVKYMRTKTDYHPSVYDIFGDYDELPSNIKLPMGDEVLDVIQKALPLTNKAFFSLSANKIIPTNKTNIRDYLEGIFDFNNEKNDICDDYNIKIDTGNSFSNPSKINEYFNIESPLLNNAFFNDYIIAFEEYITSNLNPINFSVNGNAYIDIDESIIKLDLEDNELPNTLANSKSLQVTRDMAVRSGASPFIHYNPNNYISVVNDDNERVYKCLAPTNNVKNHWFWFYEVESDYYDLTKCITHYLYVPYEVTISMDIKLPLNKKISLGAYRYDTNKSNGVSTNTSINGNGEYQRISLKVDTSPSYPFLFFHLSDNDTALGMNNPFYIKNMCIRKGNNSKYIPSKLIDTGWLNPTKTKGDIASWTAITSSTLNIDAKKGYISQQIGANSHIPFSYAGGFYNSQTIPSNGIIKRSFGAWAKQGLHNSSPSSFAESSPGTVDNWFGPCRYDSQMGLDNGIPISSIKPKTTSSIYATDVPYYVNSAILEWSNDYIKSNPSDFGMKIRLRNNSSNSGISLGFEFVTVRSWYELDSNFIEGEAVTSVIDLNSNKISQIDAVDTTHSLHYDEIVYSILDENNNLLIPEVIFPFFADQVDINKIKILSKLISYEGKISPSQEGFLLFSSKIYNL